MSPVTARPWTRHRLAAALAVLYGTNRAGHPDAEAAAAALGVSRSTVYRWLGGGAGHLPAPLPPRRLLQLRPTATAVDEQLRALQASRRAMAEIAMGEITGTWRRQRWLEPHIVAILELTAPAAMHPAARPPRLRQVTTARVGGRGEKEIPRRGRILDSIVVDGHFPAVVLANSLLLEVDAYRIAPPGWIKIGPNQVWLPDAARIDLTAMAVTSGALPALTLRPRRRRDPT